MPQVVQCPAGHFYDAAVFESHCPHCRNRLDLGRDASVTENRSEVARFAREYLKEQLLTSVRNASVVLPEDDSSTILPSGAGKEQWEKTGQGKAERAQANWETLPASGTMDEVADEPVNRDMKSGDPTLAFRAPKQSSYYVTGWIVCTDGPDRGHVFSLYQGYHSIGYGRKNQICILEDLDIAKGVHCYLIYDEKKNRFYLMPEEENPTFLNGERLTVPSEIFTGDTFQIGKTTFAFVAFCEGDRKWKKEEVLKRGRQL